MLLALTVHEAAHAWAALKMGDPTAKMLGRLTLNPLKHLDPIGTLMLFFSGLFGWAKPVPVNPRNFRNIKQGEIIVSIAGPGSNLVLAAIFAVAVRLFSAFGTGLALTMPGVYKPVLIMMEMGIIINIAMAIFNMVPIPPLDGSRVLGAVLPPRQSYAFSRVEPYGFIILIVLMYTGVFARLFSPVVYLFAGIFLGGRI